MSPITGSRVKKAFMSEAPTPIAPEEIARLAYELFERRGRTPGNDLQDWLEAERILQQRRRSGNGPQRF